MAFVQLEYYNSTAELVIFPSVYKKVEPWLNEYDIFVVKGALDMASMTKCKILVNEMVPLELFFQEWKAINTVTVELPIHYEIDAIKKIQELLPRGKTPLHITFYEQGKKLKLKTQKTVAIDNSLIEQLESHTFTVTISI
ncbi:hypothetical protein EBU95_08040 [bacterium]|nr:hypothetical protein [bacterium]